MGKVAPHVAQAQAELANARAYGQDTKAAEKRLAAAGVSPERAATARRQAAEESPEPERQRTAVPQGRTTAPRQTTEKPVAEVLVCDHPDCSATAKSPAGLAAHKRGHSAGE